MIEADSAGKVTQLLERVRGGDGAAGEVLLSLVYDELHSCARAVFSGQKQGHTLQPTALVHEAWLKLVGNLGGLDDRRHFFVVATKAMRQVLADYARGKSRAKRGGGNRKVTLAGDLDAAAAAKGVDLVALDDSLTRLSRLNERHARVVELRVFGSLTIAETAEVLAVSHGTVESDWAMAKAWLRRELREGA